MTTKFKNLPGDNHSIMQSAKYNHSIMQSAMGSQLAWRLCPVVFGDDAL